MQSSFFLPGVAQDIARIAHALATRFLEPLEQFICVVFQEKLRGKGVALFSRQ